MGALGTDGGLLWVVAGVWAVRAVTGVGVGVAWGLAVVGAGLRWGTLGLDDVAVATRVAGPTLVAGPLATKVAMGVLLAAALWSEVHTAGLSSRSWAHRAASALAIAVLVPLYLAAAPSGALLLDAAAWALTAAAVTAAVLFARPLAGRLPAWVPDVAAALGLAVVMVVA